MRKTIWIMLGLSVVGCLGAQTQDNVKLDTPQVRVVVATEQSHHSRPLHTYPTNGVIIFLAPGQMTLTSPAHKIEKLDFKAGDMLWSPAGDQRVSENISDHPFQMAVIELKKKPQDPPPPVSKLDPVAVDPKHYKVEFENDQVRVVRIRYGPHDKSALHEHVGNRVVCYITDSLNVKAGEVRLGGPSTHSEQNTLDQPVERITLELK